MPKKTAPTPTSETGTTVHVDRLRKLADFLDKLPRGDFSFNHVHVMCKRTEDSPGIEKPRGNTCGSVGRAIGWTPKVFPKLVKFARPSGTYRGVEMRASHEGYWVVVGEELFNMPHDHSNYLFTPRFAYELGTKTPWGAFRLGEDATPKQVAKSIRRYATWAEKTGVRK